MKNSAYTHYRRLSLPVNETPAGGLLDAIQLETHGERMDLLFDYHALQPTSPAGLVEREGRPWEKIQGVYAPLRLRFTNVKIIEGENVAASLMGLLPQHPDRLLYNFLGWRTLQGENIYLFDLYRPKDATLKFSARLCLAEQRPEEHWEAEFERNWSPPPLPPARLVPAPRCLWQRFGGNPITIHIDRQIRQNLFFIGGLDTQIERRPSVSAVLNLSEDASRWMATQPSYPEDRWAQKGEGTLGMTATDLAEEANWVIERLIKGKRVLVHCSAGMNRSASVCCAVLILLERLSAEAALERIYEHHPWARPDPRHWLALRWLAFTQEKSIKFS